MLDMALVVVIASAGAMALKLVTARAMDPVGDDVWSAAARRLGGELEVTQGSWLRAAYRRIQLTVEHVPLVVDTFTETDGRSSVSHTRVSAGPLPAARATRLQVAPRDLVRKLSRRLGIGELPTGDAPFDATCHVGGAPFSLVLAYLDAPTRGLVRGAATTFTIEAGTLRVVREGVPADVMALVELTRYAEALVVRWCALVRGPVQLAHRLGLATEDRFDIDDAEERVARGTHRARLTTLSVRVHEGLALTVLTFEDATAREWTLERGDDGAFVTSGEPPEPVAAFASVAPASLLGIRRTAQAVDLVFEGLGPDHEEVVSSLDSVMDATAPLDPYR